MLAVVLSGGGAKGAYEAGVWKALKKLRIKYDIVTGTSIGALNGMMFVQNSYFNCMKMWKKIDFNTIFDDFNVDNNMYKEYFDKMLKGGIETTKIEKIINNVYKPKRLYRSRKKFGVIAYNLTTKSVLFATKEDIKPDKLQKYILASATCFPVFKPLDIDNNLFVDGGYYDNLPINMAIDMGATEVIAVDLKAVGLRKKPKDKNIPITYITPNNKLDSFLKFDKESSIKMIKLGYNDTMKKFNKLEGNLYTFKKDTLSKINEYKLHDMLNSKNVKKNDKLTIIENTMKIFNLDETKIYSLKTLNKDLLKAFDKVENINIKEFDVNNIKKIFKRDVITKYIYTKLKNNDTINYTVFSFFSKEIAAAVYLLSIRS